jgi:cell division septation protein DedD
MWLQVAALRHDDAAKLVRTLKEQDFPARLADSPKPDIFRVLVGPYRQTAQVADAKAKLKSLGFANAFVQK